ARGGSDPPAFLGVRELSLNSSDGATIHAWFTAPAGWAPREGAILHSHGHGNSLAPLAGQAQRWRDHPHRALPVYDYPGFGRSTGRPSENGCYEAGEAAYRWLIQEQKVPRGEVVLVGESLGSAIATELAVRQDARLLVLHGAFTSFPDMAQVRFPMFP